MKEETVGETLQRLARESLPRHYDNACGEYNSRRYDNACGEYNSRHYCDCGEPLPVTPKTRRRRLVCDDCAAVIPRLPSGGRRPNHACFGCRTTTPRLKMKMKNGEFYCKKCLKIKFNIDF